MTEVCDGSGGTTSVPDDFDSPITDGNRCTLEACSTGQPLYLPAPAGAPCSQNGGSLCDGQGACVACVPLSQRPCYGGPANTLGVGLCAGGMQTCGPGGTWDPTCIGQVVPAADDCNTLGDESCGTGTCGAWSKRFAPDRASPPAYGSGMVVVAGMYRWYDGVVDFGSGVTLPAADSTTPGSMYVVALDEVDGSALWARSFTLSYGAWSTQYHPDDAAVLTTLIHPNGNVIIAGAFDGVIDFGQGPLTSGAGWPDPGQQSNTKAFVAAFDQDGASLWSAAYQWGGSYNGMGVVDAVLGADVDANGDLWLAGGASKVLARTSHLLKLAPDGTELAHLAVPAFQIGANDAQDIAVSPNDDIVVVGTQSGFTPFCSSVGSGVTGGYVAWLDSGLTCVGDLPLPVTLNRVAIDSTGSAIVAGSIFGTKTIGGQTYGTTGTVDAFVAKIDAAHDLAWVRTYGGAAMDEAIAVQVLSNDDVLVMGTFSGSANLGAGTVTSAGSNDYFLVRLTADGTHVSTRTFGGSSNEAVNVKSYGTGFRAAGLSLAPSGHIFITGTTPGPIDFGLGNLPTINFSDSVISRISP